MTPAEQITKMTIAIKQAIKVMGDRFGSTETDVAKAIEDLKPRCSPTAPRQPHSPDLRLIAHDLSGRLMCRSDHDALLSHA